jgi:phosphoribosyl 1,2-cyclic phosphodiesterase
MPLRFTVLASGSNGNSTLVQSDHFGLLIDVGLGPRQIANRLAVVGLTWKAIDAVILTHTHTDHWKDLTLAHLQRRKIPLFCHADHHEALATFGTNFAGLRADGLVRRFEAGEEIVVGGGLRCRSVRLRHDCPATFGFRLEMNDGLFGPPATVAYAADLGCWTPDLAEFFADADVLAVEFNHDVQLEFASGRHPELIDRVVGDDGHLSNDQAGALVHEVLARSESGRLQHVVQLHLSRDCNRPGLAQAAARRVLADYPTIGVHTASQDHVGPELVLGGVSKQRRRSGPGYRTPFRPLLRTTQPWLPGFEP